jgi:hypothetical protein
MLIRSIENAEGRVVARLELADDTPRTIVDTMTDALRRLVGARITVWLDGGVWWATRQEVTDLAAIVPTEYKALVIPPGSRLQEEDPWQTGFSRACSGSFVREAMRRLYPGQEIVWLLSAEEQGKNHD